MANLSTRQISTIVAGLGIGAGLMFLLDPRLGRRRRAIFNDKVRHGVRAGRDALVTAAVDAKHRTQGVLLEARHRLRPEGRVADNVIVARVRSQLGRCSSHPHAIRVETSEGRITLIGPVLTHEVPRILRRVGRVRGVGEVENRLEPHARAENVPGLQGTGRLELMGRWPGWSSPAVRLATGTVGLGLLLSGLGVGRVLKARRHAPITETNIDADIISTGDAIPTDELAQDDVMDETRLAV